MPTSSYDSSSTEDFPEEDQRANKRGRLAIEGRRIRIFEGRIKSGNVTKTGNQLWVTINEKTANMPYVRQAVSNKLRKENLVCC